MSWCIVLRGLVRLCELAGDWELIYARARLVGELARPDACTTVMPRELCHIPVAQLRVYFHQSPNAAASSPCFFRAGPI